MIAPMSKALESLPVRIPAAALVVLVGASGSGKSTFAAALVSGRGDPVVRRGCGPS